jgi:TolB protein
MVPKAMNRKLALFTLTLAIGAHAQISTTIIKSGQTPNFAVIDFRGASGAQPLMNTFNGTLFTDLQTSGLFKMVPKSFYPLQNPQRPEDFRDASGQGFALADWARTPVNANYLAFGYTAVQNNQIVLYGYVYDVTQQTITSAQVLFKRYVGSPDDAGSRSVAHQFAADIIAQFGGGTLIGSHIYFVSSRTGHKEIWQMDYDGQNQKPLTSYGSITTMPAVSPDGTKVAFTTFAKGTPRIMIVSTATGRALPFYNQNASMNATPSFTPDGKEIYYSSTASGPFAQIYSAGLDGSNFHRVSVARAIQVEPKVSPKGGMLAFVAGPGHQQIYQMNLEGANMERLTNGEGEAANPSWNPDGQHLLFAWTRGYATGNWNVFLMDAATRQFDQLTSGAGRNENPAWAPDGRHLVFSSTRSGSSQIWTMLADGSQLQRLTSAGNNEKPVWGK